MPAGTSALQMLGGKEHLSVPLSVFFSFLSSVRFCFGVFAHLLMLICRCVLILSRDSGRASVLLSDSDVSQRGQLAVFFFYCFFFQKADLQQQLELLQQAVNLDGR